MSEKVDGAEILSKWYTPETTYVGEAVLNDSDSGTATVTYRIPEFQCGLKPRDILRGDISFDGNEITNRQIVDADDRGHTNGHLKTFRLLPGFMGIGIIGEGVMNIYPQMRMAGHRFITFESPALPGDQIVGKIKITKESAEGVDVAGDVFNGERTHTMGRVMRFVSRKIALDEPESILPTHPLFEIMAQDAGVALFMMLEGLPEDRLPVYFGIGATRLPEVVMRAGDLLTSVAQKLEITEQNGILSAQYSVGIRRGDEVVVEPTRVKFGLISKEVLEALKEKLGGA